MLTFLGHRNATRLLALCALALCVGLSSGCRMFRGRNELSLKVPSNDRDWVPGLDVLATADFDGSQVTVHNIRNCTYLTENDYVLDHYDKTFDLTKITSVDFIVVPFKDSPSLAHTMLSFGFQDKDYVVVSVEARLEKGEVYSPLRGANQEMELMYVVGDERDLIQLRTEQRDVDVYVYRAQVGPREVRSMFVDMLERANKLSKKPEFYDTFTNNCTTNIVDHINKLNPNLIAYTYQILLPGHSDRLAYDLGLLDRSVPFETLKRRAHVNARAHVFASRADFSQQIRR
jgi:hypothetical protein